MQREAKRKKSMIDDVCKISEDSAADMDNFKLL